MSIVKLLIRFNTLCKQNRRKLVCLQTFTFCKKLFFFERARASAERDGGREAGAKKNIFALFPGPPLCVRALWNFPRFLFCLRSRRTLDKIEGLWLAVTCSAYNHQWISISFEGVKCFVSIIFCFLADLLRVLMHKFTYDQPTPLNLTCNNRSRKGVEKQAHAVVRTVAAKLQNVVIY